MPEFQTYVLFFHHFSIIFNGISLYVNVIFIKDISYDRGKIGVNTFHEVIMVYSNSRNCDAGVFADPSPLPPGTSVTWFRMTRPRFPLNHSALSSRIPVRVGWRVRRGEGSVSWPWKTNRPAWLPLALSTLSSRTT
jgi:hypothetical protein